MTDASQVDAVNHVWTSQVVHSYLKPPTGTCVHVLNMAARVGDVKLATDVFRILSERQAVFEQHHYEMLLETYLMSGDLKAALSVAVIMQEALPKIDEAAVSALYRYLMEDHSRPLEAFELLQNLENSGRKVPTAAVNACMQASVQLGRLEEAVEIYKALHTVSRAGPNTKSFNILFQGCHKAGRKELAMFLAGEMIQLGVVPDAMTYDRLVLVCCTSNDVHDAFLYYEEMKAQGHVPRNGTFEKLINTGIEAADTRTPAVLKDWQGLGLGVKREVAEAVRAKFADAAENGHESKEARYNAANP